MSKQEIREVSLRARRALPHDDVNRLSADIAENLFSVPEFQSANLIASYVAKKDEVQTDSIINMALKLGKVVIAPRTNPDTPSLTFSKISDLKELESGAFGVREPARGRESVPLSTADLVLVPVVAWDSKGNRLGYGKGYFDRELKSKGKALAVGLAFEVQRHDIIPADSEDVSLDMLVTEKRTLRFPRVSR